MAVIRRGTWWILIALVVGMLIGSGVMMYAGAKAMNESSISSAYVL